MVKSMSRLGIGLSVVFGCFFLALIAELYYVFWWRKKRRGSRASTTSSRSVEDQYTSLSRELLYLLCWKRQRCLHNNQQEPLRRGEAGVGGDATISNDDLERADRAPFMAKFFPDGIMDSEILDLHSLLGPPRVLFTIKEETKEDMDSEDGRSRKSGRGTRSRSFSSDVLIANITSERVSCGGSPMDSNTPFVTPPTSPPFCTPMATPPLTPLHATVFPSKPYPQRLSPLSDTSRFSSSTTSANSSFPSSFSSSLSHSPFLSPPSSALLHITTQNKPSKENLETTNNHSPPPKFKFLRDAEEKAKKAAKCTNNAMLTKKNEGMGNKNEQGESGSSSSASSSPMSSDEDGSFITIIVGESNNSLVPHPSSPITTPNHIHVVPTSSLMFGTTNGVKKDRHY